MPTFSSLIGQEAPIAALRRALANQQLPGCYLFVGAPGVGKGALARALAQAAACTNPILEPAFDSCGVCMSCRMAEAGTHPEIVTFLPAGELTQIWQFWERDNKPASGALSRTLSYSPSIGKMRVYIVEKAETLTESAANSLLKVLEEPPPYVLFVLLAPHQARVLPTIFSRSQTVRLSATPHTQLTEFLINSVGTDATSASMLASIAEGKTGYAVRMASTAAVGEEITRILDFAETLPGAPRVRALKIAEQMRKLALQIKAVIGEEPTASEDGDTDTGTTKEKTSRRQLAALFDLLMAFYRDLFACVAVGSQQISGAHIINRDRIERLQQHASVSGAERWMHCLDALTVARRRLDANANVALVTEVLAMALTDPRL
jgi:DNA polymerase III subunit delta'